MKLAISTFFLFCFIQGLNAQISGSSENPLSDRKRPIQAMYVEPLGPGLSFSFNYDTRFKKTNEGWGGRAGAGYIATGDFRLFTLPVQVYHLFGKENNFFEVGAGMTFVHSKDYNQNDFIEFFELNTGNYIAGTLAIGYRYQPKDSGLLFRSGISPYLTSRDFIPYWPYLSFGYSF